MSNPIEAGCAEVGCLNAALYIEIDRVDYDERTGQTTKWNRLTCKEHTDLTYVEGAAELHRVELTVRPLAEGED